MMQEADRFVGLSTNRKNLNRDDEDRVVSG